MPQAIPPLRPFTVDHLGCKWWDGRQPSTYARKDEPSQLCVVVVGRGRMEQARNNMYKVSGTVERETRTDSLDA